LPFARDSYGGTAPLPIQQERQSNESTPPNAEKIEQCQKYEACPDCNFLRLYDSPAIWRADDPSAPFVKNGLERLACPLCTVDVGFKFQRGLRVPHHPGRARPLIHQGICLIAVPIAHTAAECRGYNRAMNIGEGERTLSHSLSQFPIFEAPLACGAA